MVGDAWVGCVQLEITYNGIQMGKQRTPLARAWFTTGTIGFIGKITKEIKQVHEVFAICLQPNMKEAWLTAPPDMQELLKGYVELFKEPTQLPPQ